MPEIRAARRADLPAIYDLLDTAFGDAPRQLFVDQTEGDSTLRLRHVRVAVERDRVLAHVRVFARRMMIRGVPVRAGGIGSVASSPDARGLGLPTALLRDADAQMRREGMGVGFLFTGIPSFYERLGWRVVHEPYFIADAREVAAMPYERGYRVRRARDADVPAMLAIYRSAIAGRTGAIVRTARTWRDARAWLGEDPAGCIVAEWNDRTVAYLRARSRDYGYNLLEAEHRGGHAAAIAPLLRRASERAASLGQRIVATAPDDSTLAAMLGTMPSTQESGMPGLAEATVQYPMMMRISSLAALTKELLPTIGKRARSQRGPSFMLGLRSHGGQAVTIDVRGSGARLAKAAPEYALDEAATLDAIIGQRAPGTLARPRMPADLRRRVDALLPEVPFAFWNSDRI